MANEWQERLRTVLEPGVAKESAMSVGVELKSSQEGWTPGKEGMRRPRGREGGGADGLGSKFLKCRKRMGADLSLKGQSLPECPSPYLVAVSAPW